MKPHRALSFASRKIPCDGRFFEFCLVKLVHKVSQDRVPAVNSFFDDPPKHLGSLIHPTYSLPIHRGILVNKSVHKNSLLMPRNLIVCRQFIERTEMDSSSQQIEVDRLKDNPR